jgi:hypothetical protein
MRRPPQEHVPVLQSEMGREEGDPAEVEPPVAQHREEHRVLARGAGRGDAEVGLGLREVQGLGAVSEHGREGLTGVEASLVHLGDVGDEVDFEAAGLREDLAQATKEVLVGERRERSALVRSGPAALSCDRRRTLAATWWSVRRGPVRPGVASEGWSSLFFHERRVRPDLDSRGPIPPAGAATS